MLGELMWIVGRVGECLGLYNYRLAKHDKTGSTNPDVWCVD